MFVNIPELEKQLNTLMAYDHRSLDGLEHFLSEILKAFSIGDRWSIELHKMPKDAKHTPSNSNIKL